MIILFTAVVFDISVRPLYIGHISHTRHYTELQTENHHRNNELVQKQLFEPYLFDKL